jgi:hypothetical protein
MHAELSEAECDQGSKTNNNTKTTLFNVQPSYQTNQLLAPKYAIFVLGHSMSVSVN